MLVATAVRGAIPKANIAGTVRRDVLPVTTLTLLVTKKTAARSRTCRPVMLLLLMELSARHNWPGGSARRLRISPNKERPEDVRGEAAHQVQHRRAPKHNPTEPIGCMARSGIVWVASPASHLKFRRNCVDVNEIAGNQYSRHDEHPMLVMRHGDQPREFRKHRGYRCP